MVHLWTVQEETRVGVKRCVTGLADLWKLEHIDVIFVTQGKAVLDDYPPNWTVCDNVDQQEVLSRADVFVTHGGSNSFHEALLMKVPMVVVPFFGDQVLVGERVEELGIGIDLAEDNGIDKNKSKAFLNAELIKRIDAAVFQILSDEKYRKTFDALNLQALPPLAGLDPEPNERQAWIPC
jgi:UDP:flavonoid glycosyltransferase YjiC (YdhE family)